MGISLETLRRKMNALRDDAKSHEFIEKLERAEAEAKAIGEKYVKRVQEHPLSYYPGYEFSHWDMVTTGGYRFWFKPATEPDYSI